MATKLGQKNSWCKFRMMMMMKNFTEVEGQQRSKFKTMLYGKPNVVRKTVDASLGWWWWWWPSRRSKVNKRSNVVNNDLWLPNFVRRTADARLIWSWPSWRSAVNRGKYCKQCSMATKLGGGLRAKSVYAPFWVWYKLKSYYMIVKKKMKPFNFPFLQWKCIL